jgi:hypothetical protein
VAVLSVIRDTVTPGEFGDVLAQLGRDFAKLVSTKSSASPPSRSARVCGVARTSDSAS